jgi:hypothetical protein
MARLPMRRDAWTTGFWSIDCDHHPAYLTKFTLSIQPKNYILKRGIWCDDL